MGTMTYAPLTVSEKFSIIFFIIDSWKRGKATTLYTSVVYITKKRLQI